ncbi:MAG: hypothetical protein II363_01190 [Clostridia bacterium]|nr:hypothetical protein [Clostridia bacterium]
MEWTGRQQLFLLLLSGGVGLLLGLLSGVTEGMQRLFRVRRGASFLVDVLFGVLAALITFFASLGIMDGRLHPLLFAGLAGGFAAARFGPGRVIARWTVRLYRILAKTTACLLDAAEKGLLLVVGWPMRLFRRVFGWIWKQKKGLRFLPAKKHKKFIFFQKKA